MSDRLDITFVTSKFSFKIPPSTVVQYGQTSYQIQNMQICYSPSATSQNYHGKQGLHCWIETFPRS